MYKPYFKNLCDILVSVLSTLLVAVTLLSILFISAVAIDYNTDNSNCIVLINKKEVYTGKSRNISIMDYGNKIRIKVNSGFIGLITDETYLSSDVEIKNRK